MPRPLVAIAMDAGDRPDRYQLVCGYASAIELAGGMPWPIAYRTDLSLIPQMLERAAGVMLTGGNDLDPALWGESRHPNAIPLEQDRQRFELAFLAEAERRRLPILGVCLGCQVINVHRGGSLIQFLPDHPRAGALEHRKVGDQIFRHDITIESDSRLARAIGRTLVSANTYHKQAIARVGRGLCVTARAPDGIIEGVEDPSFPLFVGVQWHPERLLDEPEHLAVFRMLVEAAERH